MATIDRNVSLVLLFYNYHTILQLPNHSYIATYLTYYGSYRTVAPFDLPMQNTVNYTKSALSLRFSYISHPRFQGFTPGFSSPLRHPTITHLGISDIQSCVLAIVLKYKVV